MTGPGKTGLIYTKYTCLYYGTYLLFYMCYPKSVNFIEFLMDFCIYDDILHTIQVKGKSYCMLNSQNLVKSCMQIRPVFPGPVTYSETQFILMVAMCFIVL